MFAKAHIYTVHVKDDAPLEERAVLTREGFSFWAFLFNILWLLYHRLWLMAGVYLVFNLALAAVVEQLGIGEAATSMLQVGLQFWLGCIAHDAQREKLEACGYAFKGVIAAESETLATRRYFDLAHT